jgi:2'-5' RNA ligase
MARIRTFVGIEISKAIRDRLVALQEDLARTGAPVKWVEPENLHVTLLFLGEVEDKELPSVCNAIAAAAGEHSGFPMSIERTGAFPNARRPRILWVGVGQGTQEVCALHDSLEKPLIKLGCYRREERTYKPHITLGRVRSERPPDQLADALVKHAGWRAGEVAVHEVLVMSSELTSSGPLYTVLSRAKLS